MTTLHFDTDAGRMTSSTINTSSTNIQTELTNLTNRVNSMVGAEWQGNSAQIFQQEFQAWSGQLRNCMDALTQLRDRLDREINDWETAASTLA
jgi:WXG100 family type VII secretion target